MTEIDYRRVREVMWTDKRYGLRELPDFYGYPLLIKLMKKCTSDPDKDRSLDKGDVLRIHAEEVQTRLIARDDKGNHWSFPIHLGAKLEVADKKGNKTTMYMSEMAEMRKFPKRFSFAQKEEMQVKISGEDRASAAHIVAGEYKPLEIIKLRMYKANRIENDEIDARVTFLPAYLDLEFTIASKIACETDEFWEDYMANMSQDIMTKVNLNMHRGKSDIQVYYFIEKTKSKSKRSPSIYEEQAPTVSVTIGSRSIMKRRKGSKAKRSTDEKSLSIGSYPSNASFGLLTTTFAPEDSAVDEGPKKSVFEILTERAGKDETQMTEEEIRQEKHRRMMLAFLSQEENEERGEPQREDDDDDDDDDDGRRDSTDGASARYVNDEGGVVQDESESSSLSSEIYSESEKSSQSSASVSRHSSLKSESTSIGDAPSTVRSPSGEDTSLSMNDSAAGDGEASATTPMRTPPRIPTRRTPGIPSPSPASNGTVHIPIGGSEGGITSPSHHKLPPGPPLKPKPSPKPNVLGPKPVGPKPAGPKPVGPKPVGLKLVGPKPVMPVGPKPSGPKPPARPPPVSPHINSPGGSTSQIAATMATDSSDTASSRFSNVRDFPPDLAGLSIDDICTAMRLLNLSKYEQQIREHSIDGDMAKELTEDMIKEDVGMSGLDSKRFFKFIHNNWRPT